MKRKTVFFLLFLRPLLNSREVNTGNEVDSLKTGLHILEIEDVHQAQQINDNDEP